MNTTYDAVSDFAAIKNPNGAWSYGYSVSASPQAYSFIPFDAAATTDKSSGWNKAGYVNSGTPSAWVNRGNSIQYGVLPGALSLHPGPRPSGDCAVLRFTAPTTGQYIARGGFSTGDLGHMDGTIIVKGQLSPPLRHFDECLDNASEFSIGPLPLNAGETLDLIVGNKGSFAFGNTPIRFSVQSVDATNANINSYVESLGRLPPVVVTSGQLNIGSATTAAAGSGYTVVEQQRRFTQEVIENSYMNDVAMQIVWPGQVFQGKSILAADTAAVGPFARQPGTITLSTALVAKNPGSNSARVDRPDNATVTQAMLSILQARAFIDSAAPLRVNFSKATTLREMGIKAGVSIKGSAFGVDANMSLNTSFTSSTVVAVIRQDFYTVSFAPDAGGASGFWDASVSQQDLARYMGSGNPPLFVQSVTYGRLIVVSATASCSSSDLAAAFNAHYASGGVGGTVSGGLSIKEIIESSQVSVYTIGVPGSANFKHLNDAASDLTDVYNQGKKFGIDNPGAPIAFTCRHVADNTIAKTTLVAEYNEILSALGTDVHARGIQLWDGSGGGLKNTGIRINPGDKLTINSSGQIWGGTFFGLIDPNGWVGSKAPDNYPMPKGPQYSLIGKIGSKTDASYFAVGTVYDKTVDAAMGSGLLLLNLNDNIPTNGGADRHWSVNVDVVRGNAAAAGVFV